MYIMRKELGILIPESLQIISAMKVIAKLSLSPPTCQCITTKQEAPLEAFQQKETGALCELSIHENGQHLRRHAQIL